MTDKRELTTTEFIILGLLSTGPQTGYTIIQTLGNHANGWSASAGSIYPALRRLEQRGIIEGTVEAVHTRLRRTYRITTDGEAVLDAWLKGPFTNDEMLNQREIPLIKFLFAEQRLSREDILSWLDAYEKQMQSYSKLHRFWHNAQLSVSTTHQQLLLEATDMELEMQQGWVQRARARLAAEYQSDSLVVY